MSELRVRRALAETQLLEQFLAEADRRGALPFLADIMTTEGARALPMATASVEGDTVSDDAGDSPDAGRARRPTAKRSKPKTASKKKAR